MIGVSLITPIASTFLFKLTVLGLEIKKKMKVSTAALFILPTLAQAFAPASPRVAQVSLNSFS